MIGFDRIERSGNAVVRTFSPSALPLLLTRDFAAQKAVKAARRRFPKLEDAGCVIRVGSATGCNNVFLGSAKDVAIERSRFTLQPNFQYITHPGGGATIRSASTYRGTS
jgi:adenine-specific DNA-methyltransferase